MQFQAADALRDAAQNEGGGAGLGAGLGAGFAVGGQMANAFGGTAGRRLTAASACNGAMSELRKAERGRRKVLFRLRRQDGGCSSAVRQMRRQPSRGSEILFGMRFDAGKGKMCQLPARTRPRCQVLPRVRNENRSRIVDSTRNEHGRGAASTLPFSLFAIKFGQD